MSDITKLITNTVFSETKDPDDATAITWVIRNRLAKPKRFGDTIEKVVYAPHQFSGVNTEEWNKAVKQKFTSEERAIYNRTNAIVTGVWGDIIPDPTGGADHYYNPAISKPNWGKIYPVTYTGKEHLFLKEVPIKKKEKK